MTEETRESRRRSPRPAVSVRGFLPDSPWLAILVTGVMILGLSLSGGAAFGDEQENYQIGFSTNHVFDGSLKGENIDVMTGNVNLRFPIGPRYQLNEWFGYQVVLYYNSKIWEHDCETTATCQGELVGPDDYGQGFNIRFGRVYQHPEDDLNIYRYQTPDGADHFFKCGAAPGLCTAGVGGYTADSTSSYVKRTSSGWTVLPGDGTRIRLDHAYDLDGPLAERGWYTTRIETIAEEGGVPQHYVDFSYTGSAISQIEDSAGRQITISHAYSDVLITLPWIGGSVIYYDLLLDSVELQDPADDSTYTPTRKHLTEIVPPGLASNEHYQFLEYSFDGYLKRWQLPMGAEVRYYYSHFKTSTRRPYHTSMNYKEIIVDGEVYRWTYTRYGDTLIRSFDDLWQLLNGDPNVGYSNPTLVRVLDPFDNLTAYYFHATAHNSGDCDAFGCTSSWDDGLLAKVDTYSGPVMDGSRLVRRETYTYTFDNAWLEFRSGSTEDNANSIGVNSRQSEVEVMTPGSGGQPTRRRRSVYGDWTANLEIRRAREVKEYDGLQLYRKAFTNITPTLEFHDAYTYSELKDASDQVLSRTDVVFDLNQIQCQVARENVTGGGITGCTVSELNLQPGDIATVYEYDAAGNTAYVTRMGGDDGASFQRHYTYENGVVETKEFVDDQQMSIFNWLAVNRTVDPTTGLVVSSRDPAGFETDYTWDDLGRLTSISPPSPEEAIEIDYVSLLETHVTQGPSGDFTESVYSYDDLGRLSEEQKRNRWGTYDFRRTEFGIDGRMLRQSEWARVGTPDAALAWTVYDYGMFPNPNAGEPDEPESFVDPLGRPGKVTRPDGSIAETKYEGLSKRIVVHGIERVSGPLEATTIYLEDPFGRLIEVDSPGAGADAVYTYDERDNLRVVSLSDPGAGGGIQQRFFEYDDLGRLRYATNPENGTVTYQEYDARGKLLKYTDAAGRTFRNTYDAAGRLLSKKLDVEGAPVNLVVNEYDEGPGFAGSAKGKMTRQSSYKVHDGESLLVSTRDLRYGSATACAPGRGYLGLNGRLETVWTSIEPWGQELQVDYCYNELGLPSLTRYPDFTESVRTEAEVASVYENGVLASITDDARGEDYVGSVNYDPHGAVTAIARTAELRDIITRDAQGRPTQIELLLWQQVSGGGGGGDDPGCEPNGEGGWVQDMLCFQGGGGGGGPYYEWVSLWDTGQYAYDGAGNVKTIGSDWYRYDELNRLVTAHVDKGSVFDLTYGYDPYGNMTQRQKAIVGGPTTVQDFDVDPQTNHLKDPTTPGVSLYDPNGNLVQDGDRWNVFDERNRLVEVWGPGNELVAAYGYDANGYRVRSLVDGIETYYVRDASGSVLSEFRRGAELGMTEAGWDKDYIYGLGQALTLVKNETPAALPRPWATEVLDNQRKLTLNWNPAPETDVHNYRIVRTSPGYPDKIVPPPYSETSWDDEFGDDGIPKQDSTVLYYTVEAVDDAFNFSNSSPTLVVRPHDNLAPSPPTYFDGEELDRAVRLTWTASTEDDVWGYVIERKSGQGQPDVLTPTPIQATEFHDFGLVNGTTYEYTIRAVDTAGNQSVAVPDPPLEKTPQDSIPPAKPVGVTAEPGLDPGTIVVRWNPVLDYDLRATNAYLIDRSGCGTGQFWTNKGTTNYVDTGLGGAVTCTYTITAVDTSNNGSEASDPATATTRDIAIPAPESFAATFEVLEVCDWDCELDEEHPDPPCPPDEQNLNIEDTCSEANDIIRVRVSWSPVSGVDGYKIYRATGTSGAFMPWHTEPDPAATEWFDEAVDYHEYAYYVVAYKNVSGETRESPACSAPPCTAAVAIDDYSPSLPVRNVVAEDGMKEFETLNARSRKIGVKWTAIQETQLLGYHVYRKCAWHECLGPPLWSMDTFACENSWARLTEQPVSGTRAFEDITTGGLNGCFWYAVRPVWPNNELGPVRKIVAVNTARAQDPVNPDHYEIPEYVYDYSHTLRDHQYEVDRINAAVKGTGSPEGPPAPPSNVQLWFGYKEYAEPISRMSRYAQITFAPNAESDLRGYHIEMAGSYYGPWKRLTKHPVAWWETQYTVRGMGIQNVYPGPDWDEDPDPYYSGNTQCAHFRVIAVDEDGNESAPTYAVSTWEWVDGEPVLGYFTNRPGCGDAPTPPAPTNVSATGSGFDVVVSWDQVEEARSNPQDYEYYVYHWPEYSPHLYFYQTQVVPATDCDPVTDVCTYVETGNDWWNDYPGHTTPDTDCPYSDEMCDSGLEAFYITVKGPTGGESPRSEIVFWDMWIYGYASLESPAETDEAILLAESTGSDPMPEYGVCQQEGTAEQDSAGALLAEAGPEADDGPNPAIAPLLSLGAQGQGEYKIIHLHVDHLGSTRVTTDPDGTILARHDFLPFGEEVLPMVDDSTKMFTGHERDQETGLDYMLARYYASSLGRFLSVDPGFDVDDTRPESWNLYEYARNNPLAWIDPNGLETYLVVHGKGYLATDLRGGYGDVGALFRHAAETRAREIQASPAFDSGADRVEVVEVGTGNEFVQAVNADYPAGDLASIDVFSHAWGDGLNFGEGPLGDEAKRFTKDQVDQLNPSLAEGATCQLYGCGTASGQDNLAEAMAEQLGIPVTGSDTSTHFDNTEPTEDNPDVHMVPDSGGQNITVRSSGSAGISSPLPGQPMTLIVNGVRQD